MGLSSTFVPVGLCPQDPADVGGPGMLDLLGGGLQHEGVLPGRPPPEPDLKAPPAVPAGLRHAHIRRLQDNKPCLLRSSALLLLASRRHMSQ